ncbi:hypothetical protein [Spartinivicinus ruber]|uniref:hypothetical protein n=1 Tax=Spartinivicinus ruber TaxID=2683272 RepID=UPI0013D3B68B|nr:hypothetical protein [Spartinivicinus ruber]
MTLWLLMNTVFIYVYAIYDLSLVFQLGMWTAGVTSKYWGGGLIIGQALLLISMFKGSMRPLAIFINSPLIVVLYIKLIYYLILGFLISFSESIFFGFMLNASVVFLYSLLAVRVLRIKVYSFCILVMAFSLIPISYQFVRYTMLP